MELPTNRKRETWLEFTNALAPMGKIGTGRDVAKRLVNTWMPTVKKWKEARTATPRRVTDQCLSDSEIITHDCHGGRNTWQGTIDGATPEDATNATHQHHRGNNPGVRARSIGCAVIVTKPGRNPPGGTPTVIFPSRIPLKEYDRPIRQKS